MRSLIVCLAVGLALPAVAQEIRIAETSRLPALRLDRIGRIELSPLEESSAPGRPTAVRHKADVALNCENDNQIDPAYTLELLRGDLAGSILGVPVVGERYYVSELFIGLFDVGANYPTDVSFELFLYDGIEFYVSIGAFTATLTEPIAPAGEVLSFDLAAFGLEVDDEVLVLFGESASAGPPQLFPAADSSPRCLGAGAAAVCSVILPSNDDQLFAYGFEDPAACAGADPLLLGDLVVELGISTAIVEIESSSFAAVKARF
ncbi:MAG TPA: hypothetical protein VGB13_05800 [Candidatus Krumholzibacteria bacterium]|jgi:hypothetical protein